MKASQIVAPNEPLNVNTIDLGEPKENEVIVKVNAVGVCHSDLHLWEGGYDTGAGTFMKVTDRGVKFPVTPGHEIAGTVSQTGSSVQGFKEGEQVLVYPWIGCGICPACRVGDDHVCDTPRSLGIFQDGGYAEYVRVPHFKYLVKTEGLEPDGIASLSCSGLTAFTAVKKASATSQQSLVIIGAGGLGLMGIQLAKAKTGATIICLDISDDKLEAAKKQGADHVINSKDSKGAIEKVMSLTDNKGAECVIDFVNAPPTVKTAMSILRKRGKLVLVGLFGGAAEFVLPTIALKAVTIQGSYTGSYNDLVELVGLAKKKIINPIVSKKYKLEDANSALEDLKGGKITGRAVINP